MDFHQWSVQQRDRVETVLNQALQSRCPQNDHRGDGVLYHAMAWGLLGGGKRARALLAIAAGEAVGAPASRCERVGAALECIHAFSLVHDDMPCMDDDELRRGKPTVHVKFGEAQALLAGDALQTLGFELLTEVEGPPAMVVDLMAMLSRATGLSGMAGGQAVDIGAIGQAMSQSELEAMHALKTGALITASIDMGARCGDAGPPEARALGEFARHLGLAFQVADDVLDVTADAKTLGKTPGKDAAANKPTFVALLGLQGAQGYAYALHEKAMAALAPLGGRAGRLQEMAQSLLKRTH